MSSQYTLFSCLYLQRHYRQNSITYLLRRLGFIFYSCVLSVTLQLTLQLPSSYLRTQFDYSEAIIDLQSLIYLFCLYFFILSLGRYLFYFLNIFSSFLMTKQRQVVSLMLMSLSLTFSSGKRVSMKIMVFYECILSRSSIFQMMSSLFILLSMYLVSYPLSCSSGLSIRSTILSIDLFYSLLLFSWISSCRQ